MALPPPAPQIGSAVLTNGHKPPLPPVNRSGTATPWSAIIVGTLIGICVGAVTVVGFHDTNQTTPPACLEAIQAADELNTLNSEFIDSIAEVMVVDRIGSATDLVAAQGRQDSIVDQIDQTAANYRQARTQCWNSQ